MLRLEGALRDIQDASASLAELTSAPDADTYRLCFDRCRGQIRSAHWKIHTAVRTAARQEPGRPRVDRAASWWAAQAATIDGDPLLSWGCDPHRDMLSPPDTHLGQPVPADRRTPDGLLSLCIAHCGDLYDRALRTWS